MDKSFWFEIRENKYAIPEGSSAAELTEELFSYTGSTDPDLRDTVGYETFANWLDQKKYSVEQVRSYIPRLSINLQHELGEQGTDSVFMRSFSVLFLAEIIYVDNKDPFLEREDINSIFTKGLAYLEAEQDLRGYVPEKGWAHALAHTADLFFVLAGNRFIARAELEQILNAISGKLTQPTEWIHQHNEDDRLVRAVLGVVQRKLLDDLSYKQWLNSFIFSDGVKRPWKGSFENQSIHHAYFNTRNFLRSLHLNLVEKQKLANRSFLLAEIENTLKELKQF